MSVIVFVLTLDEIDGVSEIMPQINKEWADRIIEWYNPKFKISYIDWHKNGNYNDKKLDTKEELMDFYQEHYYNVKLYFKNNLLVHNVFENDGYDTLCKFLNKEIPTNSYPTLKNEKVKN